MFPQGRTGGRGGIHIHGIFLLSLLDGLFAKTRLIPGCASNYVDMVLIANIMSVFAEHM